MKVIRKTKSVQYNVVLAYDGTEFSPETFGSLDAAKEEAKKYEASAEDSITYKAMKVLIPYVVPGSDKLSIDNVPESVKKDMPEWRKKLFNPAELAVQCIASELYTANWSCLSDVATRVYIFKPKKQSDIDSVVQYCKIIGAPVNDWVYKEKYYSKDLAAILNHYNPDCADDIVVGRAYIVILVPCNETTCVIDIENVLSLWTELLRDVKENY